METRVMTAFMCLHVPRVSFLLRTANGALNALACFSGKNNKQVTAFMQLMQGSGIEGS